MSTARIIVDGLSRRYGAFWALRDASFSIRPGEILGLIGPNGSGKTTLFECVAGLQPPTAGSVNISGQVVPPERRKKFLFMVPDGIRPWPQQTVRHVLQSAAGMHKAALGAVEQTVMELELGALQSARLGELSKGEHRRVMLAIGLLTQQPLLLLDEPFDGLDLRQTREVMSVLRDHARRGRTLFLSIHQLNDAARICDRLLLLSDGRIVGSGSIEELKVTANVIEGGLEEIFLALT